MNIHRFKFWKYKLHTVFSRCHYCHWRKAVWSYMPGPEEACDVCVPRGCSCQQDPIDENHENGDPLNWADRRDDTGRLLPCVEWMNFT